MRPFIVRFAVAAALGTSLVAAVAATADERGPNGKKATVTLDLPGMDRPAELEAKATKAKVLRTPGYKGGRTVPRAAAPQPPAPVVIGKGSMPSVTVDAAGTSHIVWNESVADSESDITHYCRIPRGAKACNNPNQTPMPINVPYSGDYEGPKILQVGDQLVVLTHRYPAVVTHPGGATSDRTTYAWTSVDGGTTWSGPAIVGNLPTHSVALVGGDNPRIAAITSTYTPGLFMQLIDAGSYTSGSTLLADPSTGLIYGGTVAPAGNGIVAAASGPVGPVLVRKVGDTGGASNAAAWTSAQIAGEDPYVAGGPSGPFLLTKTAKRPTLWSVDQGGAPARVASLFPTEADPVALTQDASGKLIASWVAGTPSVLSVSRVNPNGTGGSAYPAAKGVIDQVASSAAFDGGGVMVYRRDATGLFTGDIAVAAFGTLAPTNRSGAGSLAGTGIPGGFAGCKSAGFGSVTLAPTIGCLLQSTDAKYRGAYVSRAAVDLNGISLIPDAGVSIIFNPQKRTLDTTGKVTVALQGDAIGTVPLAHLELHVRMSGANGTSLFSGVDLPSGALIKGFPIDADFDILIDGNGVKIPVSLKLPPALGGVSGSATLRATLGKGVSVDSFALGAKQIPLGPVSIKNLKIEYAVDGDRWTGGATVDFTTGGVGLDVEFAKGRFISGKFQVDLPRPGVMVFSNVWLTQVRGGLRLEPQFAATVGVSLGIIYTPPTKKYAADVLGDLTMTIRGGQLNFVATGNVAVGGLQIGTGRAEVDTSGYASLRVQSLIDLEVAQIEGQLGGFFDGRSQLWGVDASSTVHALGIELSQVAVAASSKGLGACATASPPLPPLPKWDGLKFKGLTPAHMQVTYRWGGSADVGVGTSCSLEGYHVPDPGLTGKERRSHEIQPGDRQISVTSRQTVNVMVTGTGGAAPNIDVIDPTGAVVDRAATSVLRFPVSADRVLIVLAAPATGVWTFRPVSGAIADLQTARELAPVKVTGKLSGKATARRISYRVNAPAGTLVEFRETWKGGGRVVRSATAKRSGTVSLPVDGRGGLRSVVAVAIRDGIPQQTFTLAKYRAPAPTRLAAPRGVVVSATSVRWASVRGATKYVVSADLKSGRRVAVSVAGSRRTVRIPGASKKASIRRVRITALDARLRLGRTTTAVAKTKKR